MKRRSTFLLLGSLAAPRISMSCLWDSDTLGIEASRFPGVGYLIVGQFPRHSKEYHLWRKKDAEAALAQNKRVWGWYNDLAVSQHKLGDHRGAIATMMAKEALMPRLYETYSNLGTFHIYTGELNAALEWIDKALAINPNAHFGRERYQRWLVEWLQTELVGQPKVPEGGRQPSFSAFLATKLNQTSIKPPRGGWDLTEPQRREAIQGVAGMMHFADFDNPLLLEALGDLLTIGKIANDAERHACIAYLHAHEKAKGTSAADRLAAKHAAIRHMIREPIDLTAVLEQGLANGKALAEDVRQSEIAWIKAGVDVAEEFRKKYFAAK
jgi:tetratricopeptide (TPR) repeat protein